LSNIIEAPEVKEYSMKVESIEPSSQLEFFPGLSDGEQHEEAKVRNYDDSYDFEHVGGIELYKKQVIQP
jgi:hypothetical protein